ncbi:hypothetical protein S100072_03404 [Bacillus velezensis]|nr:hypothetical protein S100072_03404 [Bacillus velezensis]
MAEHTLKDTAFSVLNLSPVVQGERLLNRSATAWI